MLEVERVATGPLRANCYVARQQRDAIVIDPGDEFEAIDKIIVARRVEVHAVLCTHAHHDHLGAAVAVAEKYAAPFHMHRDDAFLLRRANLFRKFAHGDGPVPIPSIEVPLEDGMRLRFGTLEVEVIHVPGHSPGSVCFAISGELFVGDLATWGETGPSGAPGGDRLALAESVRQLEERFGSDAVVQPGHGEPLALAEIAPPVSLGRETGR